MDDWTLEFSDDTKTLVVARQRLIPSGTGYPMCPCCGEPIRGRPDFHHRKPKEKGGKTSAPGDGRPSNCLAVHNRLEGEQCHFAFIHNDVAAARIAGWIILRSAKEPAFRGAVKLAYRAEGINPELPWVVLDDLGGYRQATPSEVFGSRAARR